MPVYNGARFLCEQVDSILAQQGVALRLVILDDGSTDDSFALATNLAEQDGRITLAERRPNVGLTAAVSRLLSFVESPYFAMSDQDDVWDPDKLHRSIVALNQPGVKLVYSDVRIIDEYGTVIEDSYWTSRAIRPVSGTNLLPVVFRNPIIGHTIVASADVASAVREIPRDLIYYEVWIAAAATRVGFIGYVNAQLGSYRIHSSNVVGPLGRRFHARLFRKLSEPRRLHIRQQQRIAALAAISEDRAEYELLAEFYNQGFAERMRNLPRLLRELGNWRPALGYSLILKETLMHLLIGPGNGGRHAK
jgi:glycosyltransferase involved in cell wall biosynthesis